MQISVKVEGLDKLGYLARQVPFATAKALTKTVQQGQAEVIKTLGNVFSLRTNWYKPSNQIGIRITPAKKQNLIAEVKTNAAFLKLHEEGLTKFPYRKYLAIPTENVRRTKRDLIPKSQQPRALKNAFVVKTRKGGRLLMTRTGKGKKQMVKAMYVLVPKAKIRQTSVFYEPVRRAVAVNLQNNFNEAFRDAIRTAK